MDAKEQAKDLWTKIRQCGRARLEELTPLDMLSLAINPPRKDKLLDEEEEYAVAIISSALSAQAAEVERLNNTLGLREARITELRESRDYWFREYTELERETNELHQPEPTP